MTAIHLDRYGEGQPLVMLHGWAMHTGIWQGFARQLAQHYQVIGVDLPGHGFSQEISPFDLTHACQTLLAAIPVPRFRLLGWSLGATLAIAMAANAPERVVDLILLAGNPLFIKTDTWHGVKPEVLTAFANSLGANPQQTLTRFLALQVNGLEHGKVLLHELKTAVLARPAPTTATLQAGLALLQHSDLRQTLSQLSCPITVIQGDRDTLIPPTTAAAIQALNPHAKTYVLEKAGHVPFLSHSQAIIDAIASCD